MSKSIAINIKLHENGPALCPERYDTTALERIRKTVSEYHFSALYQQRPRSRSGALFPVGCIKVADAAPVALSARVRYWDTASAAPGKGDWTVGVLMGRTAENEFIILDVVRGQWPANERNKVIKATAETDRLRFGRVAIFVERPPGLAKESTEAIVTMLAGFVAEADPVSGDKSSRAEPLSAQCRAGNVSMVRLAGPVGQRDMADFLRVVHDFPFGAHDDDVDAASGAFNKLAVAPIGTIRKIKSVTHR